MRYLNFLQFSFKVSLIKSVLTNSIQPLGVFVYKQLHFMKRFFHTVILSNSRGILTESSSV
jgi:hypothetical protein